jgi:hypothetical protein
MMVFWLGAVLMVIVSAAVAVCATWSEGRQLDEQPWGDQRFDR